MKNALHSFLKHLEPSVLPKKHFKTYSVHFSLRQRKAINLHNWEAETEFFGILLGKNGLNG